MKHDRNETPLENELNVLKVLAENIVALKARVLHLETLPAKARVLLGDSLLTASQTTIDFQNLSQNFRALEIIGQTRSDRVATSDGVALRFNNDSGANYDWIWTDARHTIATSVPTEGSNDAVGDTQLEQGFFPAASAPANVFGSFKILILYYAETNVYKTVQMVGGHLNVQARENIFVNNAHGVWRNISAISRVTLLPVLGTNFVADTHVSIYGLV